MQKKIRVDKFFIAVTLLWIVIAIEVISSIFNFPNSLKLANASGLGLWWLISTLSFSLLFIIFLVWKIEQGRNWARITYLVLFVLGVPFIIYVYLTSEVSAFLIILGIVGMIMQIIALVFLFQKPSSDWFKSIKK